MINIFYSWQSDLPNRHNRGFIQTSIEKAIKRLNRESKLELNLDRDTKNSTGAPDISAEIFKKIGNSQIFIADISIVNKRNVLHKLLNKRSIPNPNVLIELGFAVGNINWSNCILILNSKYGDVTSLPFDLRGRKPLIFNSDNTTKDELSKIIYNELNPLCELIDNLKDHPITKQLTFFNNKIGKIYHEVRVLISVLNDHSKNKIDLVSGEFPENELISEICSGVNAQTQIVSMLDRTLPFPNCFRYLEFKKKKIKELLKDLFQFKDNLKLELLSILTRIDVVLTDFFDLDEKMYANSNLDSWSYQIKEIKELVEEAVNIFNEFYELHIKEYHKQYRIKRKNKLESS